MLALPFSVKAFFFPLFVLKERFERGLVACRNMLGNLLLSRKQWENDHVVRRCCAVVAFDPMKNDFRSAYEIIGAEAVACHATTSCKSKYSLSTCKHHDVQGSSLMRLMQR